MKEHIYDIQSESILVFYYNYYIQVLNGAI